MLDANADFVGHVEARQAEVHDERAKPAALRFDHHDVLGLEIAVHDARGVRGRQPVGELDEQRQRVARRIWPVRAQVLRQRHAREILHGEEREWAQRFVPGVAAEIEDAANVRVGHAARGRDLLLEPPERARVAGQLRVQGLERDNRAEQGVVDLVHLAHRADAEQTAHVVTVRDQHPRRQHRRAHAIGEARAAHAGGARRLGEQLRAAVAVCKVTVERAALRAFERAREQAHHAVFGETAPFFTRHGRIITGLMG